MSTQRPAYCSLNDALARLYSESDPTTVPSGGIRDSLLTDLIQILSRQFDELCEREPGAFYPMYETRLFSGRGAQVMNIDEVAVITKLEINPNPTTYPATWTDYTSDMTSGQAALRPLRFWPKNELFRMNTFFVDPLRGGNVRITGLWGAVQPDLGAPQPTVSGGVVNDPLFPTLAGVTTANMQAMSPNGGASGGWWITPEMVKHVIASWSVYSFKASQSGYGDRGGSMNAPGITYDKKVPPFVQQVVDHFTNERPKLAMIGTDGTDFFEENAYQVNPDLSNSRWADWQTQ